MGTTTPTEYETLEAAAAIAGTPLFAALTRVQRAGIAAQLEERSFAPGAVVVLEGESATSLYVVRSGHAEVVVGHSAGNQRPIAVLSAGDTIGESSLLGGGPESTSVIALSPLTVWGIAQARFKDLVGRERAVAQQVEQALARRISVAGQELAKLAEESANGHASSGQVAVVPIPEDFPAVAEQPAASSASASSATSASPLRRVRWKLVVGWAASLALIGLGWLAPVPDGLSRGGMVTVTTVLASVPLIGSGALPKYAVSLLMIAALVIPRVATPQQALAGFATSAWLLILLLGTITSVVVRSGLLYRIALIALAKMPARYVPQSLFLALTGTVLTAGITSGTARTALGMPIAREIATAMRYAKHSAGAAALGLVTMLAFGQIETVFLTGATGNLLVYGLLSEADQEHITWPFWVLAAALPHIILFGIVYLAISLRFRPPSRASLDRHVVRLQQRLLGPLTSDEKIVSVALVALLVGFVTKPLHGLDAAWVTIMVSLGLFLSGRMDRTAIEGGTSMSVLMSLGITLSMRGLFRGQHVDQWLGSYVQPLLAGAGGGPMTFILALALVAWGIHFVVDWMTASTLLALIAIPIGESIGINPFVPVMVVLFAGNHTFFPYVNSGYVVSHRASGDELFSHAQARPILWVDAFARLVAIPLSLPVWHALGLM